ncbi:transcriptional regulator, SARP family [Kribbella flavida DSM 17836]|uniref:Transcriptional regulator, SARP family n=1 Tax=Kribbella flavida (strain DSM 17836 / JCM 10339 / NBRC 14399) TaxID=479435 RepID=D2PM37_KRIFD|nr:BTAD domain-containing putative transcriptional regulator [Kribbella flavida]ADB34405.1 transcriptional regulator, SARP family [Kribbella flavida DSM 17836]
MTAVFRLLGPIAVLEEGRELRIGAPRLRTLLAALLVNANQTVTATELVQWLWGGEPPARPQGALHTTVFRLRALLGPDATLRTVAGGYRLDLPPGALDLDRFRELAAAGTVEDLTEALRLWRGEPLTGALEHPAVLDQRAVLTEEWLRVTEQLVDARLAQGDHNELIAELTALTKQYPLRERFWAQLMLALHRSARQADALAAYLELAKLLREELGIDPGEEIRRLHHVVLAGDGPGDDLDPDTEVRPVQPPPDWQVHRQLPIEIGDFVGRHDEADAIVDRLTSPSGVPVVAISGPPGAGKTALAVRVAHRLRDEYPDGQWYVRLDGARDSERDPSEVLRALLELAGAEVLTGDADTLSARLRSLLVDRRVLILLDDAKDSQQVRPLLPGTRHSAVLVTSRNELTGLSVLDSALCTTVAVLEVDEAVDLLRAVIGSARVDREPEAAAELAKLCGCLPLALRIAASHLAAQAGDSIASYAEELRAGDRLFALSVAGEPDAAVEVAFDRSYEALVPESQQLFALLGIVPGPDVTAPAAAVLLDTTLAVARRLLDTLVTANLLVRQRDRYCMHDLLRLYAARRAAVHPAAEGAWLRLCDWYLRTADAATQFEYMPSVRITPRLSDERMFVLAAEARQWLEDEEAGLVAVIKRASEHGPQETAWRLADVLRQYLTLNHRVDPWRTAVLAGLSAAQTTRDLGGQGAMLHSMGALQFVSGDTAAAIASAEQAAELYQRAGFGLGHAALLCNLGMAHDDQGDSARAAELLERGIAGLREYDSPAAMVNALNSLSNVECNLGNLDAALAAADEAMTTAPDVRSRTVAMFNRGVAYRLLGDLEQAERDLGQAALSDDESLPLQYEAALLYADLGYLEEAESWARRALTRSRGNGQPWHEAAALNALGTIYRRRGRWNDAVRCHQAAGGIARSNGHRATVAESVLGLAEADLGQGQRDRAAELARQALLAARRLGHRILACRALLLLAVLEPAGGHEAEAAALQQATGFVARAS